MNPLHKVSSNQYPLDIVRAYDKQSARSKAQNFQDAMKNLLVLLAANVAAAYEASTWRPATYSPTTTPTATIPTCGVRTPSRLKFQDKRERTRETDKKKPNRFPASSVLSRQSAVASPTLTASAPAPTPCSRPPRGAWSPRVGV